MAHYNCVKWEIFENMQRGSVVGAGVRFLSRFTQCLIQSELITTNFHYNRMQIADLYEIQCYMAISIATLYKW